MTGIIRNAAIKRLNLANIAVTSINGLVGVVTLTSPDNSIDIVVDGQNIELETTNSPTGSKVPCSYATITPLPDNHYNNGSSGIGATLTGDDIGQLFIDGNLVLAGQSLLIKDELTAKWNGIYTVTSAGSLSSVYLLTRRNDFDTSQEMVTGDTVYITGGTLAGTTWRFTTPMPIVVGSTDITWERDFVHLLNGHIFVGNSSNEATDVAMSGDATINNTGIFTLATVNSNIGSFGSATQVAVPTVNAKGLITAISNTNIQIAESQVTNLVSDLASKQSTGNYIIALTGDGTANGPGSVVFTLATVNSNVGTFGSSTAIPVPTVNAKGLITAITTAAVIAPAGTLTGTTLASNVVTSSITTIGTLVAGGVPFSLLTSGTNSSAAMVIDSGASLGVTGTGAINVTGAGGLNVSGSGLASFTGAGFSVNGPGSMRLNGATSVGIECLAAASTSNVKATLTSNTSGHHALFTAEVAGVNTNSDPYIYFKNSNASTDLSLGSDTSDSGAFVISNSATLGTNNRFRMTLAGAITTGLWNATAIGEIYGGTNQTSYTQGDILYASAANTLSKLAKNTTATRYLSNTGTTNNPAWAQIDLTNGVTGTLPVGNGGTGATAFTLGSVVFAGTSGVYTQDNANFFWDDTNNRLGIGRTNPVRKFECVGNISSTDGGASASIKELSVLYDTANDRGSITCIHQGTAYKDLLIDLGAQGNLGISTTSFGASSKGVISIFNASVIPTGNATNSYILYVTGGALKGRGTGGTVTNIGNAEPHCPKCGADFGHGWENPLYGGQMLICKICEIDYTENLRKTLKYVTDNNLEGLAEMRNFLEGGLEHVLWNPERTDEYKGIKIPTQIGILMTEKIQNNSININ